MWSNSKHVFMTNQLGLINWSRIVPKTFTIYFIITIQTIPTSQYDSRYDISNFTPRFKQDPSTIRLKTEVSSCTAEVRLVIFLCSPDILRIQMFGEGEIERLPAPIQIAAT